jgi:SAM-dependent methyltransferase
MPDQLDAAREAAEAYESLHVEALFRQFAQPVLRAAGVSAGHSVLDVACGTGVVAREAVNLVGSTGSVTGLDIDTGMLAVAQDREPSIQFLQADASSLPLDDDEFDAVVSQFGLMFFPDRVAALSEMLRCTRPGGQVVVAVWDDLARSPVYSRAVELLGRRGGPPAADALSAPFALGEPDELRSLAEAAGAATTSIDSVDGTARFPGLEVMMNAELRGWLPVCGVVLDEPTIGHILDEAEELFAEYVTSNREMCFPVRAHLLTMAAD